MSSLYSDRGLLCQAVQHSISHTDIEQERHTKKDVGPLSSNPGSFRLEATHRWKSCAGLKHPLRREGAVVGVEEAADSYGTLFSRLQNSAV